jgi:hypothetical protein
MATSSLWQRGSARLALYGLSLVAVLGAGLGVGQLAGPTSTPAASSTSSSTHAHTDSEGNPDMTTTHAEPSTSGPHAGHAAGAAPAGLSIESDGYRLAPLTTVVPTGAPQDFRFRILGPDGAAVSRYDVEHDKELHFIVVRRDLAGYQHLHPTRAADGTWSVPLQLAAAGDYKAFADFTPAGGSPLTLAVDLHAAGTYAPAPLPPPSRTATVDGYTVTLDGHAHAGEASELTLRITRDGRDVTDLDPYLAAYGHLVALRVGDLAYLHEHPEGAPGDGHTLPGPEVSFSAQLPTVGTYRLFLDFSHAGRVHTAEFTVEADAHS